MSDGAREAVARRYAGIRYPAAVQPPTHPRRLAAVARLFGLQPPDPLGASILELGAGPGANALWLARTLPGAGVRAVELDPDASRAGADAARAQGLGNLTCTPGDLMDLAFSGERYDYIIANGLLSWVGEGVQQRLLELCRDRLTPDGVAMLSFNVLPGWATRDALRQLLLLEGDGAAPPAPGADQMDAELQAIDRVLRFFEAALPGVAGQAHAPKLALSVEVMRQRPPAVLLHDEAGAVSEPLYLLQFTQWAAETGLAYVADARIGHDWMEIFPRALKRAIADSGFPRLKALQYADFVLDTHYRSAIVCQAQRGAQVLPAPDLDALFALHSSTALGEAAFGGPSAGRGAPAADEQAVLDLLADRGGELSVEDLWAAAQTLDAFTGAQHGGDLRRHFARRVLTIACGGRVALATGPAAGG